MRPQIAASSGVAVRTVTRGVESVGMNSPCVRNFITAGRNAVDDFLLHSIKLCSIKYLTIENRKVDFVQTNAGDCNHLPRRERRVDISERQYDAPYQRVE